VTLIATIIRAIGLPACIVIGLLVYYEGLPGAHRIPFLTSVPIIGDLTTGRVHSYAADQVRLATAELVARSELTAARAQLARERELRQAADTAAIHAQLRAHAADRAKAEAQARLDALIAADTSEDGATWTEGDLRWLAQ
jgi:hypothetical protein